MTTLSVTTLSVTTSVTTKKMVTRTGDHTVTTCDHMWPHCDHKCTSCFFLLLPQLNLDSNANLNHVLNSSSNLVKYECNSIQNPNRKRLVYILEGKYVCSCNSYFKNGLICRHIFALSNLRQDKDLTYILINKRWQQPVITDNTMQIDVWQLCFWS